MASSIEPLQLKNGASCEYSASENLFSCSVCQNICVSREELTAHMMVCKLEKHFSCSVCKKTFDRKADMEYHVKVHSDEKPFTCHVCDRVFKTKTNKDFHMRVHTGENKFACRVCDGKFTTSYQVTKHMMLHADQEPFCVICSKTFLAWSSLGPHLKIHSRRFPCSICPKEFKRKNELTHHMKLHRRYRNSCGVCRKVFARKAEMKNHMIIHSGERPFTCQICMKSYARKSDRTIHMRVHTGEKPFSCDLCNMAFTWKVQLTNHLDVHSREKRTCLTCMKTFASDSQLRTHMKNCTGKNPFFCEFCKTMFLKEKDLNNHTVIRMGRKRFRYGCCVCEETFSRKCKMHSHIKTHTRKNRATNEKCKTVKEECERTVKIEIGSEGENQSWSEFGNNTVSGVETTPWTSDHTDETIACSACGMDFAWTENWYIMDVGSGAAVTLCNKCQHVPIQCALCYNIIEFMDLRSHLGMHTGEIAWMSYSS